MPNLNGIGIGVGSLTGGLVSTMALKSEHVRNLVLKALTRRSHIILFAHSLGRHQRRNIGLTLIVLIYHHLGGLSRAIGTLGSGLIQNKIFGLNDQNANTLKMGGHMNLDVTRHLNGQRHLLGIFLNLAQRTRSSINQGHGVKRAVAGAVSRTRVVLTHMPTVRLFGSTNKAQLGNRIRLQRSNKHLNRDVSNLKRRVFKVQENGRSTLSTHVTRDTRRVNGAQLTGRVTAMKIGILTRGHGLTRTLTRRAYRLVSGLLRKATLLTAAGMQRSTMHTRIITTHRSERPNIVLHLTVPQRTRNINVLVLVHTSVTLTVRGHLNSGLNRIHGKVNTRGSISIVSINRRTLAVTLNSTTTRNSRTLAQE